MNKKAEFGLDFFAIVIIVAILFGLLTYAVIISENNEKDKFKRLCDLKEMEYFGYNQPGFSNDITVICLDNNGNQHEVDLK